MRKICTRCKKNKKRSKFRKRIKRGYTYCNPTCKKCDSEITQINYQKKKNDTEFKRINRLRAAVYNKKNRVKVLAKKKAYRERPEIRARRLQYDKDNKDRIKIMSRARNKKYYKKLHNAITDIYVKRILRTAAFKNKGSAVNTTFTKQQIAQKKKSIALFRLKKLLKDIENEEQNRRFKEPAVYPDGETERLQ